VVKMVSHDRIRMVRDGMPMMLIRKACYRNASGSA
jgi:hypothetical protein